MVFEGERTEKIIFDNLRNFFLKNNAIVYALYGNVIYEIYEKLREDEDDFLDIVPILKEFSQNRTMLEKITRDKISEIYLFFDHDGHSHIADIDKLEDMLKYFNNETENGKLYISYPMVEAFKHIGQNIDFNTLTAKIEDNSSYKKRVNDEADNKFKQINKYTEEIWKEIIFYHVEKLQFITSSQDDYITQYEIFTNQKKYYIKPNKVVTVLGSFPIFLLDYYGYDICEK